MFIDQGFMRKNEPEWLVETFERDFKIQVHFIRQETALYRASLVSVIPREAEEYRR